MLILQVWTDQLSWNTRCCLLLYRLLKKTALLSLSLQKCEFYHWWSLLTFILWSFVGCNDHTAHRSVLSGTILIRTYMPTTLWSFLIHHLLHWSNPNWWSSSSLDLLYHPASWWPQYHQRALPFCYFSINKTSSYTCWDLLI